MPDVAVEIAGLTHSYPTADGDLVVLDDLDLTVAVGGRVAIVGPSGSGKSTLLSLIGGLEAAQVGTVAVGGQDLGELRGDELARFRGRTVGFVFQHFGLLESLTAIENVELAATMAGTPRRRRRDAALGLLAAVGLAERADHVPAALSGGERQRVAIARALVNDPRLVLADEPTGNLDAESAARVASVLDLAVEERGATLLVVTHDATLAARAERVLALDGGRLRDPSRV